MASKSEIGHAKNVANFQDLIEFVVGYGSNYNPSKNGLQLAQLNVQKADAEAELQNVIDKNTEYNTKVNERLDAFSGLRKLGTRLISALEATDASEATIKDAQGFNRKIQGKRAAKIETPVDPNEPAPKTISAAQLSYDQLIQHLAGLKAVLKSEPTYAPNETDLQTDKLQDKIENLTLKNTEVATAFTGISNARINRNKKLYTNNDNLVDTAGEVKKYVKSVYGASSPEYVQVRKVKFSKTIG